jgi:Uma2 family endonuclease
MTREEYYTWAERQPTGKFERVNGVVVAMASERLIHNIVKAMAWQVLRNAVAVAGLSCDVFTGGVTVEVGDSDYEPDAVLRCGPKLSPNAMTVPDPLRAWPTITASFCGVDQALSLCFERQLRRRADALICRRCLIIVEVLSPSTSAIDRAWKLKEYFRLPTVRHYLIIWPDRHQIAHHCRGNNGDIETQTVVAGKIVLDPPGIKIAVEDIYAE